MGEEPGTFAPYPAIASGVIREFVVHSRFHDFYGTYVTVELPCI